MADHWPNPEDDDVGLWFGDEVGDAYRAADNTYNELTAYRAKFERELKEFRKLIEKRWYGLKDELLAGDFVTKVQRIVAWAGDCDQPLDAVWWRGPWTRCGCVLVNFHPDSGVLYLNLPKFKVINLDGFRVRQQKLMYWDRPRCGAVEELFYGRVNFMGVVEPTTKEPGPTTAHVKLTVLDGPCPALVAAHSRWRALGVSNPPDAYHALRVPDGWYDEMTPI